MKKDWIDDIAETTYEHYNKRKIVLWGKYPVSDSIREALNERYGIETAFYVDSNIEKIDNYQVFPTNSLAGKSKDYYVVIPLAFYQSLKDELMMWGYEKDSDYYYFTDCIIQQTSDYYEDLHGNKIVGAYSGKVKFCFSGFDSTIIIGEHVHFYESMIYVHNDVKIKLGDNLDLVKSNICAYDNVQIVIGDSVSIKQSTINIDNSSDIMIEKGCSICDLSITMDNDAGILLGQDTKVLYGGDWTVNGRAKIKIGERGIFGNGKLVAAKNTQIKIGNDFSINSTYQIIANSYTSILVGDDCMISYDVILRSNDGHSIFDLNTGKNISSEKEISKSRKIVIGDHVWVGIRSVILYNSEIGNGSIIGAASLVKSKIPNNCIAVGIPAKIKKDNIAWDRKEGMEILQRKWDFRNKAGGLQ